MLSQKQEYPIRKKPYHILFLYVCSVLFSSVAQSCPALCDPMNRSTPGLPVHHQLPEFTQTHVHRVGDAIQPSHPLSSPSPPAPNPSQHQSLFQWVNSSREVAKGLEFQLSHQSFRRNPWVGRLQNGLVGSPCGPRDPQESSPTPPFSQKHPFFRRSAFFTVQRSHPYMTTGKTVALTGRTFVGKGMSLLLNMLSRLVITFLSRSKCLLIWWLQSPSAVILEPPKNKVWHCFHYLPIYFPWSSGTGGHDLRFLNVEL